MHPVGGGNRSHHAAPQRVYRALQDDGADGRDGKLQPHGHARVQQAQAQFFIELTLLLFNVQDEELALNVPQAQKPGNQLRSHGRVSRARHAQRHDRDEHNVQRDVDDTGDDQINQRRAAIAQGAQHRGQQVV